MGRVIAGIGLRGGCDADAILRALDHACAMAGRRPHALAAPAFKAAEPGPAEAARRLGLALVWVETAAMQQANASCATQSAASLRATGVASVSEACALAAAGPGARLLAPRVAQDGATCALAEATAP
ncbi:MAG TPA: cobalamin biosynthesis protein [Acidisphaera sp.]|nr:cobalamin biosynthesis protein [Acidisphaera sp.]